MSSLYKLQVKLTPDINTVILFVVLFILINCHYYYYFLFYRMERLIQANPDHPGLRYAFLFFSFFQIVCHIKRKSVLKITYRRESVVALLIKFKCQYTKKLH